MTHIKAGEARAGVQQGSPSANVAKLFCPPGTCATPDADHGTACT